MEGASSFPELLFQCPIRLRKAMPSVYTRSRAGDTGLTQHNPALAMDLSVHLMNTVSFAHCSSLKVVPITQRLKATGRSINC